MSEPAEISSARFRCEIWLTLACYVACVAALLGYIRFVGPVVFVADSLLLTEPAKYLAGRSLPGGADLYFFYRPLTSLLWLPAYFFSQPASIVFAVQLVNALIYALAIWPLRILLREYVKLTAGESLLVACVFLLGPCTLIYVPILLTETIYVPIFLFLVLVTWRRTQDPKVAWDVACGLLLGLCYLSRHAGSIVPVAWVLAEGVRLLRRGEDWKAKIILFKSGALVVVIAAAIIASWMATEHILNRGQGGGAGAALVEELASNHGRALAWAANLFQYLVWAPPGFLLLVGGCVFLTSPKYFCRDSTALFVFGTAGLAILSTVFFQGSQWGDRTLTLNRYLGPYLVPLAIIAWRYVPGCGGKYVLAAALIAGVSWSLGFPEMLNTHFRDYLAWTKLAVPELQWWGRFTHSVFGICMAVGLICCWRQWKRAAIFLLVLVTFLSDIGAAVYWRNYSERRCRPGLESAGKVWKAARREPSELALEEHRLTDFDREILSFQCFYPEQLPRMKLEDLLRAMRKGSPLLVVSRSRFSSGQPFDASSPVWEFPQGLPPKITSLVRMPPFSDESTSQIKIAGQRQGVMLLDGPLSFEVECAGEESSFDLVLQTLSPKVGRRLRITDPQGGLLFATDLPAGTLKDGWREIRVPLKLRPGVNSMILTADGPSGNLGRRQVRILLSERVDVRPAGK